MSVSYDVVVVGAGLAGWTAALRSVQLGAKTLLIDKCPGDLGGGNSLMTSGSFFTAGMTPTTHSDVLIAKVMSQGIASPDLVRSWAMTCGQAIDWLRAAGVEVTIEPSNGHPWLEHESRICYAPVFWQDVGTKLLGKLKVSYERAGGDFWPATPAVRLDASPNAVHGLIAQREGSLVEIAARSTVLATGGFSANSEMLTRYIGPLAGECKVRGSAANTGDGLRMALAAGAGAVNLPYFYGHLQSLKCLVDDRFWPYPRFDSLVLAGILVDRQGHRFVDERRGDVAVTNVLARSQDPRGATLIFDHRAWDESVPQSQKVPSPNPWLKDNDGELYSADTPEGLAGALSIDAGILHGSLTEAGRPLDAPLYGVRVVPGITFTMGGIRISGQAEAVTPEGQPISGLYAAGDAIGGLMGGYDGGYTGGLSQAVVTGLLAGENATAGSSGSRSS